ncbi:hypothetical protein TNCV_1621111 [Trichonephila clavipes]|nr:hypothetical protein TNCV_1621111 [Trichonephila clavipes]
MSPNAAIIGTCVGTVSTVGCISRHLVAPVDLTKLVDGVTMESLHYSSTTVSMAIRFRVQADDFGVFLLGFGTGLLIISCIAYTYVNRKSVVTGNVR